MKLRRTLWLACNMLWALGIGAVLFWLTRKEEDNTGEMVCDMDYIDWDDDPGVDVDED